MTTGIQLLRAAERVATPWKNGGGVTRELCRDPRSEGSDAFEWRVSIAEVSQPGPFSRFAGYRRLIALIAGQGMQLHSAANEELLLRPFEPHSFDGASDVRGVLPFGPVSDLNVIFRPDAIRASLRFSSRAERWEPQDGQTVILINVQPTPLPCLTAGQPVTLDALDAVVATTGASLSRPAGGPCAIVEMERLQSAGAGSSLE